MEKINIQDLLPDEDPETDDAAPEQEADDIEEKLLTENIQPTLRLDYKLKTCAERADLVNRIVELTPSEKLSSRYLEILGDYIMGGLSKEEKKGRLYLTDNRMLTINKRETSFEGLAEKFENGEDGVYQLMTDNKNILLTPKLEITQEDIDTIPGLRELRESMRATEEAAKAATGKRKYLLKKQLIEMRRDQYALKTSFKPTMCITPSARGANKIDLTEHRYLDKDGNPQSDGLVSFFNPQHIQAILSNYNALRIEMVGRHSSDFFYLMEEFEALLNKTFVDHPEFLYLLRQKFEGKQSIEIQQGLKDNFNISYSTQYISSLWRNKLPKMIAEQAQNDYIIWHYTYEEKGAWKRCSCCGQRKPAHPRFFSKNNTSKDGWYSVCKICRNKK